MNKPYPHTLAGKISPDQKQELISWLTDHSYSEVQALIAAPPPEGFGLEVSIPTISRFYKANFGVIDEQRRELIGNRSAEQTHYAEALDEYHRQGLEDGITLLLQERFFELLCRPVENVDELKKLAHVGRIMKQLNIEIDPGIASTTRLLRKAALDPRSLKKYHQDDNVTPGDAKDQDASSFAKAHSGSGLPCSAAA